MARRSEGEGAGGRQNEWPVECDMKRIKTAMALMAAAAFGATGCATGSVTKTAQAAPITYKIGQGDAQYAAIAMPKRQSRAARPIAVPQPAPAQRGVQPRSFDMSRVDPQLYKHQKVGKRYTIMGKSYTPKHQPNYDVVGLGSWYGPNFHGKPTATGEIFDKTAITAAHKTLPLNSMLFVTNLENGRTLTVRLNDRGPFVGERILDLSEAAAEALGFKNAGKAKLRVQYAGPADPMAASRSVARPARPVPAPMENIVEAPAPYVPAPIAPLPVVPSIPQFKAPEYKAPSVPAPIAPSAPVRAPEGDLPGGEDVTLTIKGQIHIASADETVEPRWITGAVRTR